MEGVEVSRHVSQRSETVSVEVLILWRREHSETETETFL